MNTTRALQLASLSLQWLLLLLQGQLQTLVALGLLLLAVGLAGQPYLELRNSDAHAWSEVWLPGQGWVAVDPTAWVVPERVRRSLAASLGATDRARLSRTAPGWLRAAAQLWRGLDYRWQLWVMGFDRQRQMLGESPWIGMVAPAGMPVALAAALLPLWWSTRRRSDRARHHLDRLLRELAQRGHGLQRGEALATYCRRVGGSMPELPRSLSRVGDLSTTSGVLRQSSKRAGIRL